MRKIFVIITLILLVAIVIACAPTDDPAAPYYPTYTAIAQGLIDLSYTATANAATAQVIAQQPELTASGTGLEILADGSTRFSDFDAGYEVTVPAGWLVVRPGQPEYAAALANEGSQNATLKDSLEENQNLDPAIRAFAYDLKPSSNPSVEIPGMVVFQWTADDETPIKDGINQSVRQIEQDPAYAGTGIKVVSTNVSVNPNNVEIGSLGAKWSLKNNLDELVTMYMHLAFFKGKQGTSGITATLPNDLRGEVEPDVQAMIDTIKILGQ